MPLLSGLSCPSRHLFPPLDSLRRTALHLLTRHKVGLLPLKVGRQHPGARLPPEAPLLPAVLQLLAVLLRPVGLLLRAVRLLWADLILG